MRNSIIVKTSFEGLHQYVNAPDEVAFLRNLHRHIFHVEAEIEVFDEDRELEFVIVKRALNRYLYSRPFGSTYSCEQMARQIINHLIEKFGKRKMCVTVLEDNENGGRVYYED